MTALQTEINYLKTVLSQHGIIAPAQTIRLTNPLLTTIANAHADTTLNGRVHISVGRN